MDEKRRKIEKFYEWMSRHIHTSTHSYRQTDLRIQVKNNFKIIVLWKLLLFIYWLSLSLYTKQPIHYLV